MHTLVPMIHLKKQEHVASRYHRVVSRVLRAELHHRFGAPLGESATVSGFGACGTEVDSLS